MIANALSAASRRAAPSSLLLLFCLLGASGVARAQDPDIPPGWVVVDDLILPADVVFGESTYSATQWPGGVVPYAFNANVTAANQEVAIDAMAEWAAAAALTFVPRTTQANYVVFKDSNSNSSFVGMVGGAQTINIYNWNYRFIVCHEICHALGFWHEQSRPDRNTYVTINSANVDPAYLYNFNIVSGATTYGAYDFDSIMHYGQTAFSINGLPTITVLPPNQGWQTGIGQRQHLSLLDAAGMATRYGAPPAPTISALTPASGSVGMGSFTLTVDGTAFCLGSNNGSGMPGSVVEWDGIALATTYVDPTRLTAVVPAAYVAAGGAHAITVYNGSPGGGVSVSASFAVGVPAPTLASLSPASANAGSPQTTTTATGLGFTASSVVRWDGVAVPTTFVDGSHLTATLSAALLASGGTHEVTVHTPAPGGGTSAPLPFSVNHPAPLLFGVAPTSVVAGSGSFVVTANGLSFDAASVVRWNGSPLATTFVSSAQLTAVVPASLTGIPGSASVSVQTPTPGGGTTSNQTVTLVNSAPTLTALSPASAPQFSPGITIGLTGSGFHAASVAKWNNANLTTTFVDATHLTAVVPAANLFAQGSASVKVQNTGAGGGTSASLTFVVTPPAPIVSLLSPSSANAGGGTFVLTVNGSYFQTGSVVRWNDAPLATTYGSTTQLSATVPAALLAAPGAAAVTVLNPNGGWVSAPATFTIVPGVPVLASLAPSQAPVGSGPTTVLATGSGFAATSVLRWNGTNLATTYVDATTLSATIPSANLVSAATASLTVFTPAPGGGTSGALTFTVANPLPVAASVTPPSTTAGASGVTLTVTGSGFLSGVSSVRWNGAPLTTTFVSATQLTASAPASLLTTATTASITVVNAPPGGGTSGAVSFAVNNPVPVTVLLSPTSAIAGDVPFTLTVLGVNFNASTQIRWNGVPVTTTLSAPSQLQATIGASLIAKAGTASVTTFNPGPGGGTSNAVPFAINGPQIASLSPSSSAPFAAPTDSLVVTLVGARFLPTAVVWANGVALATTYLSPLSVSCVLTGAVAQTSGPGGVAFVVRNGGTASSNARAFVVGGGANAGTQSTDPPSAVPPWGGFFDLLIEGGAPGAPFTLLVDLAATATTTGFPTPAANFVLDVGSPATIPLLDGLGLFGPPGPWTFGPDLGGTPPGGVFVLPNLAAPAAPSGVELALQAAYLDATSPVGWRLSWAAAPRPY